MTDERPLTPRQRDILPLLAAGKTNEQIAAALGVEPETIRAHLKLVYERLGIRGQLGRVQAAVWWVQQGEQEK